MTFLSTKTYGHEVGLSATFRQWRATSHCRLLHGYALSFKFIFEAKHLDERNWVVDFGSLKPLKSHLEHAFDHKLVVAEDDPEIDTFIQLEKQGLALLKILPNVGCEAFAKYAYDLASGMIDNDRVRVQSASCAEHAGNSAIYIQENPFV